MIFTTHQRRRQLNKPANVNNNLKNGIKLQQHNITNTSDTKFLGTIVNENLSWKNFFEQQALKANKGICTLNQLKHIVPKKSLIQIYYTIILPHLQYGILAWGGHLDGLSKLEMIQKEAIRKITKSHHNAHTDHLFSELNILKLKDIYNSQVCKFIYKYKQNSIPSYFDNFFDDHKLSPEYNSPQLVGTRNDHTYNRPTYNEFFMPSANRLKSLRYTCYEIWEKLPMHLINFNGTLETFNAKLKKHYLEGYPKAQTCFVRNCFSCDKYNDPLYNDAYYYYHDLNFNYDPYGPLNVSQ